MADAAGATRNRLLEAARELFTTTGYHATTTPMLASKAGVAEGTIYRHFPSKQALLNAAYQETQHWGAATIRDVMTGPPRPARDRLRTLGRVWLETAERDPARIRLLLLWRGNPDLDDASRAAASEWRQALEHLIAVGKQEGSVRSGGVELWTSVWLALAGFAAQRVADREWQAHQGYATATIDAAWEAIAARGKGAEAANQAGTSAAQ
jgi:TetR/AcrR family transcriptional regulator, repressor of fatR-cypB operon